MRKNVIGMGIVTVLLALIGVWQKGFDVIPQGILGGLKMLVNVTPLLLAAFLLTGMIQVLISQELIKKWLGKDAGLKGIFLGAIAGALIPRGPYVYYPIAASFLMSGAEIGTVIAYSCFSNGGFFTGSNSS